MDPVRNAKTEAYNMRVAGLQSQAADERNANNQDAAKALKAMLKTGEGKYFSFSFQKDTLAKEQIGCEKLLHVYVLRIVF